MTISSRCIFNTVSLTFTVSLLRANELLVSLSLKGVYVVACDEKGAWKSALLSTTSTVSTGTKASNGPVAMLSVLKQLFHGALILLPTAVCDMTQCRCSLLAVQTSQWEQTLDLGDQQAVNLPTTTHPHVATYGTYSNCTQTWNDSSLCKRGTAQVPRRAVSAHHSTWPHSHLTTAPLSSYSNTVWTVLPGNGLRKHCTRQLLQETSVALWKIRCYYCAHTHLFR